MMEIDISNIALNYAVALSNSTGAELYILRILKDVEKSWRCYSGRFP